MVYRVFITKEVILDADSWEEACEKALKRKETENKLKALAFELNGNKDIDWTNEKDKYYIYYNLKYNLIRSDIAYDFKDMNIYCSSEYFKDNRNCVTCFILYLLCIPSNKARVFPFSRLPLFSGNRLYCGSILCK